MLKRETELSKNKAVAILMYTLMQSGKRHPTVELMKIIKLSQNHLYKGIKTLTTHKLIKTYNGNTKGGLEKITDFSIKNLCGILGVVYSNDNDVINKCNEVIANVREPIACDICSESVLFVDKHGVCVDCLELEEPVAEPKLARCGHFSFTRYFKCEACLESLESDDSETYSIHLTKRK